MGRTGWPVACRSWATGVRVECVPGEGCTAGRHPYREEGKGQHRPRLPRPCSGSRALGWVLWVCWPGRVAGRDAKVDEWP